MEQTSALIQDFELISSVYPGDCYVVDIVNERFCHIKSDGLFLCGFSVEEAQQQGYNFYSKIVYPEDLSLWEDMCKIILQHLKAQDEKKEDIDYFSCTFRLQRKYSFASHLLPQMIYHRTKPIWFDNNLHYLICNLESTTNQETGNLQIHNKDESKYTEYNFQTKRWKQKEKVSLTERESAILILAQQGKSSKEMANLLYKGQNTIRNQMKSLFSKLGVHSMQEAIEFAHNYHLIYPMQDKGL